MAQPWIAQAFSRSGAHPSRPAFPVLAAIALLSLALVAPPARTARQESVAAKPIPSAEFSRMVRTFSEEEGDFSSDNYISNEFSYLHVVDKLKEMGVAGGAYIGVGPEQNFSYIAKVRPEIAFIVDIRRQAIIQHLMYKAIFQMSDDRAHFLSLLFSKPLDAKDAPGADATIKDLVSYFEQTPGSQELYASNLAGIRGMIEKDFGVPLSLADKEKLDHVYGAFRQANLNIFTRWSGPDYRGAPTLKDLLLETDNKGRQGNFLASREDYEFVRDLHRKNRIVPVVGDFAGGKAFSSVAGYLKDNGIVVSAIYTSNVEQYLFGNEVFVSFAGNVAKLPINDKSVFIRASRGGHQSNRGYYGYGFRSTVLEKITLFLADFNDGLYSSYGRLLENHQIDPDAP